MPESFASHGADVVRHAAPPGDPVAESMPGLLNSLVQLQDMKGRCFVMLRRFGKDQGVWNVLHQYLIPSILTGSMYVCFSRK